MDLERALVFVECISASTRLLIGAADRACTSCNTVDCLTSWALNLSNICGPLLVRYDPGF